MSGVKSKPVYSPLAANPRARYHVLLGVGAEAMASLARVLEDLHAARARIRVFHAGVSAAAAAPLLGTGLGEVASFGDPRALLEHVRTVLAQSLMGTHLYVAGPESFIGRAMQIALSFNLNKDEVSAEHVGSAARRVRCVHCRTDTEEVATNIVRCSGCGRWLQVRDHYSRRFAAYMGVMADAEVPGELPAVREIHP